MISKELETAFNKQINAEFYSEYLYLSMKAYFADLNLNGFVNWFTVQVQEEHQVDQHLQHRGDRDHHTVDGAREVARHHHPERDDGQHHRQHEADQVRLHGAMAFAAGAVVVCMVVMCHYSAPLR